MPYRHSCGRDLEPRPSGSTSVSWRPYRAVCAQALQPPNPTMAMCVTTQKGMFQIKGQTSCRCSNPILSKHRTLPYPTLPFPILPFPNHSTLPVPSLSVSTLPDPAPDQGTQAARAYKGNMLEQRKMACQVYYIVHEYKGSARVPAFAAPLLRVGQGSTSNCSIQYLVE